MESGLLYTIAKDVSILGNLLKWRLTLFRE